MAHFFKRFLTKSMLKTIVFNHQKMFFMDQQHSFLWVSMNGYGLKHNLILLIYFYFAIFVANNLVWRF